MNGMSFVFFVTYIGQPLLFFFFDFLLLTSVYSHVNEKEPSAFSFLIQASITQFALSLLVGRLSCVTSLTSSCLSFFRERERKKKNIIAI